MRERKSKGGRGKENPLSSESEMKGNERSWTEIGRRKPKSSIYSSHLSSHPNFFFSSFLSTFFQLSLSYSMKSHFIWSVKEREEVFSKEGNHLKGDQKNSLLDRCSTFIHFVGSDRPSVSLLLSLRLSSSLSFLFFFFSLISLLLLSFFSSSIYSFIYPFLSPFCSILFIYQ